MADKKKKAEECPDIAENTQPSEQQLEVVEEEGPAAKLNEAKDQYLRLLAEFDNYKKRTMKEKVQVYTDSVADVVEKILPVLDNLQRASLSSDVNEGSVLEGVRLVTKQLEDILSSIGINSIDAEGNEFDPELHNAVMHIEDADLEANIVVEEFSKGYEYKGKVIRHSMVKVAN